MFLVGTTREAETSLQKELDQESDLHQDIVQENFIDSYANLTLKTIGGVKWSQTYCAQVHR